MVKRGLVKLTKKNAALLAALLILCGAALFYYAWAAPYPIRDMNGDGKIDWKDYDVNYPTLKGGASMQRMVKGWFTSAPSKGI